MHTHIHPYNLNPHLSKRSPNGPWLCAYHSTSFFWVHFSATLQGADCCQWAYEQQWCVSLLGKALRADVKFLCSLSSFSKGAARQPTLLEESHGLPQTATWARNKRPLCSATEIWGLLLCQRLSMLTNTNRNFDKGGVLSQWGKIIIPKKVGQLFILRGKKARILAYSSLLNAF